MLPRYPNVVPGRLSPRPDVRPLPHTLTTRATIVACAFVSMLPGSQGLASDLPRRPNVLVVITDDQGYGDLGCHGNPKIKTPNLDRFAAQSVRLESFYVSPVCSPTRASLMTGRYNYRTGVVDTFLGRSLMHADEVTLAEALAAAGYRTGIFGKWHLGDNYPLRPMDQGFQECLVHRGGGIGQPADPPGNSYTGPVLQHNGRPVKTKGYCSDVFTEAAIAFLGRRSEKPFFAYLAYNCPHTPLQVHDRYADPYRKMDLSHAAFPKLGHPLPGRPDVESTARVYGMVTNVDENLGRLFAKLDELKLAADTLVIFLTDNGPQQPRYNAGMLQRKGNVHEGGIRVPCYVRWPSRLKSGHKVSQPAAHIDLAPTVLAACGVEKPGGVRFDGLSLLSLLQGKVIEWPDRTLYFQWHRGDAPELYRAFAARSARYKLVQPLSPNAPPPKHMALKLYDMQADPLEQKDIAAEKPEVVARMKKGYEEWFRDVGGTRGYAPPQIHLGAPQENPTTLTRQDWRGPRASWAPGSLGHWEVQVARAGTYRVTLHFAPPSLAGTAHFALAGVTKKQELEKGDTRCVLEGVPLKEGPGRLEAWLAEGKETRGVDHVEVERMN